LGLVGAEASNRVADHRLEASRIHWAIAEPVLQCSHARRPLFVLTSAQIVGESAISEKSQPGRGGRLWYECTDTSGPDSLLSAPGTRVNDNNFKGENSWQLH
jgi:hypothetical protein